MNAPQAGTLVHMWERGVDCSPAGRGLLLLELALPGSPPEQQAQLSIGHRDSCLIDLREHLFGGTIEALSACGRCGEAIAIEFELDGIRAPHAAPGTVVVIRAGGRSLRFRLPNSSDLIAIEQERDFDAAERRLLGRCLVEGRASDAERVQAASDSISRALGDADPQAELMLDIACPGCGEGQAAPFDIVTHLWSEITDWVMDMFEEVDLLAARYGWSEADILAMRPARRRAYLDLIATAPA
jgi:hypothetical protein